jgi:hypothetical protein
LPSTSAAASSSSVNTSANLKDRIVSLYALWDATFHW